MVTKPTGKPVGRPRKPRPPRRACAGRPTLPFRNDPDRYAVALLDAMLALEMGSERACAMGIAALQVGIEAGSRRILNERVVTNWHRKHTGPGSLAATLRGRESTLRAKQRRIRSAEERTWRTTMASTFMLVLGARDPEAVKAAVLARAQSVGEGKFAKHLMLPMLAAKFSSS
jgi:hypothetical protein